jgi:hypothetical protein
LIGDEIGYRRRWGSYGRRASTRCAHLDADRGGGEAQTLTGCTSPRVPTTDNNTRIRRCLSALGGARAFSLFVRRCFAGAERIALHALEQVLHGHRVRCFVHLGEYHRTGRCNPAEQG